MTRRVTGAVGLGLVASAATFALASTEPARDVTYIPAVAVEDAFSRGVPLVEVASYKVHASRREAPGRAEVHEVDTDLVYVLDGTATFVTGGSITAPETIARAEIRGDAIQGGHEWLLQPGDFVSVPAGTPHWFREIEGPFLYYVVKVPDGAVIP